MAPTKLALHLQIVALLVASAAAHGHDAAWSSSNMAEGVVIGVLDDGINAGHPSFGDEGMPPPPAR